MPPAKLKDETVALPFKMPPVSLGDTVIWYPGTERRDPCAAVVTAVGSGAISLSLFPPGSRGCMPKEGVRHIDSPNAFQQFGDLGFWDLSDQAKRFNDLARKMSEYGIK